MGHRTTRRNDEESFVLDVDSYLPYPCRLLQYLDRAFHHINQNPLNHKFGKQGVFAPRFRVVPAEHYIKYFYSDRMHMYRYSEGEDSTGRWLATPPSYDCIMDGYQYETHKKKHDEQVSKDHINEVKENESKKERKSNLDKYIKMDIKQRRAGECNFNALLSTSQVNSKNKEEDEIRFGVVMTWDEFREFFKPKASSNMIHNR
mmetsp:Transcript_57353/g.69010  ORF Transcript_57353/g.69010 Transcript_57353/m.69010 type:complete len:203 (-) Transcript_57353:185-793(-)